MPRNPLSAHLVKAITRPAVHAVDANLYVRVRATGARSWIFRYQRDGRRRDMGLGPLHTISLAEAREKALQCRRWLYAGLDPVEMMRATRWARSLVGDADQPKPRLVKRAAAPTNS